MRWNIKGTELTCPELNLKIVVAPTESGTTGAAEKMAQQIAAMLGSPAEYEYLSTVGQCGHSPKRPGGGGWRLMHTTQMEARQVQWTWERPILPDAVGG
jgi:hypothetical protein